MSLRYAILAFRRGDEELYLEPEPSEEYIDEFLYALKQHGSCLRKFKFGNGILPKSIEKALEPFYENIHTISWSPHLYNIDHARVVMKCKNLKCLKLDAHEVNHVQFVKTLTECMKLEEVCVPANAWHFGTMHFYLANLANLPNLYSLNIMTHSSPDDISGLTMLFNACRSLTHCTVRFVYPRIIAIPKNVYQSFIDACSRMKYLYFDTADALSNASCNLKWKFTQIETLRISDIWQNSFYHMLHPLRTSTSIREVHLSGLIITDTTATTLGHCVGKLERLKFHSCKPLDTYSVHIFMGLSSESRLKELVLQHVKIDARVVFRQLQQCVQLTSLDMSYVYVSKDEMYDLCDCLEKLRKLEHLLLRCNLYEQLMAPFSRSIQNLTELRSCIIRTFDGHIEALTDDFAITGLKHHTNLQKLELDGIFSKKGYKHLSNVVARCKDLKELTIFTDVINDNALIALSEGFRASTNLQLLYLNANSNVSKLGTNALFASLRECTNLKLVSVGMDHNDTEVSKGFAKHLPCINGKYDLSTCYQYLLNDNGILSMANDLFIRGCLGAGPITLGGRFSLESMDTIGRILHGLHPNSLIRCDAYDNNEKWKQYKKAARARRAMHVFLGAGFSPNTAAFNFVARDGDFAVMSRVLRWLM